MPVEPLLGPEDDSAGSRLDEERKQEYAQELAVEDLSDKRVKGCGPALLAIMGLLIVVVVTVLLLVFDTGGSSKSGTAATPGTGESPSGLDGHWVLASGLKDTYRDMPTSCSHVCDAAGHTLTIDVPQAEIDIVGTKITGGFYKVGFKSVLAGDKCAVDIEAHENGTVSGGVDINKDYGTVIIDGKVTGSHGCDQNFNPIPLGNQGTSGGHLSRFFYVKGDTMFLCYNLTASLDACSDPAHGSAATFKRG